jgi:hypothetical protein
LRKKKKIYVEVAGDVKEIIDDKGNKILVKRILSINQDGSIIAEDLTGKIITITINVKKKEPGFYAVPV